MAMSAAHATGMLDLWRAGERRSKRGREGRGGDFQEVQGSSHREETGRGDKKEKKKRIDKVAC